MNLIARAELCSSLVAVHLAAQAVAYDPDAAASLALFVALIPAVVEDAIFAGGLVILDVRVLARYDVADPNIGVDDDGSSRLIAGVACLGSKFTQVVLDYQQTDPQKSGALTAKAGFVHFLAKF